MSSGGDIQYTQSPEQRQMFQSLMPMFQSISNYGQNLYSSGAPNLGAPSMSGVLTGQPMYDIPDPSMAMPTSDWFNSLSPDVMKGLYAPYKDASNQMLEAMGSRGQVGSAGSPYTGAAGAAMGKFWADAGQDIGLNAWNMTSPMAMNNWNAQLNRNINQYNTGQQEALGDYNTSMQAWQAPMNMMGYMPSTYSQAYTQAPGNPIGGALSGGLMGGIGGSKIPESIVSGPWGMIGGAGLGALSGLFS